MEWKNQILPILPPRLQSIFAALSGQAAEELEEIRLCSGKALMIHSRGLSLDCHIFCSSVA